MNSKIDTNKTTTPNDQPLWSVMIPTYNPNPEYLKETLQSILQQDPGQGKMQIAIIDDCTPNTNNSIKNIITENTTRIENYKTNTNLGLAGCWNTCIKKAKGQWVHILHQDDLVLPDFYKRAENLIAKERDLDAIYSRHIYADADSHWTAISKLEQKEPGKLINFAESIAIWQRIECAAVIVKKTTYNEIGEFRTDIPYVLDWEMWCRIAATKQWGYIPQPSAIYRCHTASETARLNRSGQILNAILAGAKIARSHFSNDIQTKTLNAFKDFFARHVIRLATQAYENKDYKTAINILNAFRYETITTQYRTCWLSLSLKSILKLIRI